MNNTSYNISAGGPSVIGGNAQYSPPGKRLIDSGELSLRLNLPASWVREQVRRRAVDPLPHFRMGKYVRFDWDSAELQNWIARRLVSSADEANRSTRKQVIQ